jgi:hypothetical protein
MRLDSEIVVRRDVESQASLPPPDDFREAFFVF